MFEQVRLRGKKEINKKKRREKKKLSSRVEVSRGRRENSRRQIKAPSWNTDGDHNEEIETRDELTVKQRGNSGESLSGSLA